MMRFLFILLLLCHIPGTGWANTGYNHDALKSIPVLHEGRVKPLEAFARIYLKRFSGRTALEDGTAAMAWLTEALLDPRAASEQKVFLIDHEALKEKIGFIGYERDVFSYIELQEGLRKTAPDIAKLQDVPEDELSITSKKLMKLHYDVLAYAQILRSFSLLLPLNVDIPKQYDIPKDGHGMITYYDLIKIVPTLQDDLQRIIKRRGTDVSRYTKREQAITKLARELDVLQQGASNNVLLRILPLTFGQEAGDWASPWEAVQMGTADPKVLGYIKRWRDAIAAYHVQDEAAWNIATQAIRDTAQEMTETRVSSFKMDVERWYLIGHPLFLALGFYIAAFLLFTLQQRYEAISSKFFHVSVGLALSLHAVEMACRIFILERPPVATLYESVIFVAFFCAALCYWFYLKTQKTEQIVIGLLCAAFLIVIAPYFVSDASNNLETLQAVLNTNFWLATHVIVITAGYGICLITACLAHYRLYRTGFTKITKKATKSLDDSVHAASILSLLLVAVGTILGGIWADQSWGRFWGWDPKENGALLIVLWIVWIQHGLYDQKLSKEMYLALMAGLNVIVALSWFGVNLLGVGLHSYGFADGFFAYLVLFCVAQSAVIALLWRKNVVSNAKE